MKLIGAALGMAFTISTVGAQDIKTTTKEKTKIEVKDGKDVKVIGCLERGAEGSYMLTNDVGDFKYRLVTDDNYSKYIGRRVEIKGIATDRGDGKVKIESTVGTTGQIGDLKLDDTKRKTTTVVEGDLGLRYLGVRSLKKISDSCR